MGFHSIRTKAFAFPPKNMWIGILISFLALPVLGRMSAQEQRKTENALDNASDSASVVVSKPTSSEDSAQAAAKNAAQNPVASVISIPIQSNTEYGVGPYRRALNETLIEPVIPFRLTENWILITRTIIPVVVLPRLSPNSNVTYGLGNMEPQFYLSPAHPGKIIWGAGPELYLPTASDDSLSVNSSLVPIGRKWAGGVDAVALTKHGHWLGGVLLNNEWAGLNHNHVNEMTLNPFLYYNFSHGWYLVSSEVMGADWTAPRNQRWTVPAGGGFGRVFKVGKKALNARTQFWNDTQRQVGGPSWTMQTQLQLLYPRR